MEGVCGQKKKNWGIRVGEGDKRESGRKGGVRINKQDVTAGAQFQTQVVRDGGKNE